MDFARHEFKLNKPDKDGISEREHLEAVERQIGRRPEGLDGPEFPHLMEYVWSAFLSLQSARTAGFSGPNPITYQDILAWKQLTDTPLSPKEVDIVKRLDRIYLEVFSNG